MTDTLMNRVPRDSLNPARQAAWDHSVKTSGDATIVEVFANSEKANDFFSRHFYQGLFFEGDVPRIYKELVRYRLSLIHGCNFCNRNNSASSLDAGLSQEKLDAIEDWENGPFDEAEKAVLAFAEELALTNMGGALNESLYARLKANFSDSDIIELGMVGAVLGGMNKLAFVLDVVAKEDYCPFGPEVAEAAE